MERFAILEDNIDRVEKKMVTVQNKCRKYGCEFTYNRVGEEYRTLKDKNDNEYIAKYIIVEAEGVALINDWEFVAAVDHTDAGNVVRKSIDDAVIPERFFTTAPKCEHCGSPLIHSYLVRNTKTGDYKQVGSTCLKDFTCGMDASAIAAFYSAFDELIKGEAPAEGGFKFYYETEEMLEIAGETVRKFGYRSSSEGYSGSTKERVADIWGWKRNRLFPAIQESYDKELTSVGFNETSDENVAYVHDALKWLDEQEADTDYMNNLKVICKMNYLDPKHLGYLVSLFACYNRYLGKVEERKRKEAEAAQEAQFSKHVGTIGQRIEFVIGSVNCVSGWETMWGYTYLYRIKDVDGNVFIWKTSKYVDGDDDFGNILRGTVKEHSEYNGVPQTVITNCAIKENKAKKQEEHPEYTGESEKAFNEFYEMMEAM